MEVLKKLIIISALMSVMSQVNAFEFSGYLRSGVGYSESGDTQSCFALDATKSKYRLGNEWALLHKDLKDNTLLI